MRNQLRNRALIVILLVNVVLNVILFATVGGVENQFSNPAFWITWFVTFPVNIGVWAFIYYYTSAPHREDEINLIPIIYTACGFNAFFIFIGMITMYIKAENYSWKAALIIEFILLVIYAIALIYLCTGIKYIRTTRETVKKKVFYIRDLYTDLEAIFSMIKDADALKKVQALADDIKYSDPMSHESLLDIETEIKMIVGDIVSAAMNNENEVIVSKVELASNKLKFRNTKCKILK